MVPHPTRGWRAAMSPTSEDESKRHDPTWDQDWPAEVQSSLDVREFTVANLIKKRTIPSLPEGTWVNPLFPLAQFPKFPGEK